MIAEGELDHRTYLGSHYAESVSPKWEPAVRPYPKSSISFQQGYYRQDFLFHLEISQSFQDSLLIIVSVQKWQSWAVQLDVFAGTAQT